MQPNPIAETSRLLFPSLRFCMINSSFRCNAVELRACYARRQFDRRRSRFWAHHHVDVGCSLAAVLGAVRGVDLVVEVGVGVEEHRVFLDAACTDTTFAAHLDAAEPFGVAPIRGSDIEIVADAYSPDPHRVSQRSIASKWRDLQFFCSSDLVQLIARPRR